MKKDGLIVGNARFSKDRKGAAEIIGDILLVMMSVVLVSMLALQLGSVSQPGDTVRVDLEASYDGQNITIQHMGGDTLQNSSTNFHLFINDTMLRRANVTDGLGDTAWDMGESWKLNFPTNPTQRVEIQVIDTKGKAIILDQLLLRGPDSGNAPDIGLIASDIVVWYRNATINDTNIPMAGENVTINITIHNYGNVNATSFMVRVTDYSTLDKRSHTINNTLVSNLNASSVLNLSMRYRIASGSWGIHTFTVRVVPLPDETRLANNYASLELRIGYQIIEFSPSRPVLRIRSIEAFPRFPIHGSVINLTARVSNQGGVPANATIRYYDGNNTTLIGIDTGVGVPVGGESISTLVWKTTRGGIHTIIVNATDPCGTSDQQSMQLEVLPTVLLVDDDRAGEGGLRDVITPMKATLDAVAASYTVHYVAGGDGPMYDGGEHPLKDYDLVIWMTGYEDTQTLTASDQSNLGRYLDGKGKLWLIGQDIVSGLGLGNAFLNNYLKLSALTPAGYLNVGTSDPVEGVNILPGTDINITKPFPGGLSDKGDCMVPTAGKAVAAFREKAGLLRANSILFNATTNGSGDTHTAALFGFEPSQITRYNDRAMMVYEMLKWFNCSAVWGRDLSVSDQYYDKPSPSFMEDVNITIYVRNNGLNDEPEDLSTPQLQVGFYVDGFPFDPKKVTIEYNGCMTIFDPSTSELWIPQDTPNPNLEITGRGGYIKVSMVWTASVIGTHTITGKVDPYDYIEEINELNNRVSSSLARESLFVRYGTLVVDDDDSANNRVGSTNYNATANLTAALDFLGYGYDLHTVAGNGDGPSFAKMEFYNAILWCTGQTTGSLTANDKTNLSSFLSKGDGRYFWLLGQDAVPDGSYSTAAGDAFYRDYLRLGRVIDPPAPKTPSVLEGISGDSISHGMRYPAQPTFTDSGSALVPYEGGRGVLYQSPMSGTDASNEVNYVNAENGMASIMEWFPRVSPPATLAQVDARYDASRQSNVMWLNRTVANVQNTAFIVGDVSSTVNSNPLDTPWLEPSRFMAQWSYRTTISHTFLWYVTDTGGVDRILTYDNTDSDNLGAGPVHHGLGAWTNDNQWHTVTRNLLADLRDGTGMGGLNIRTVNGFEVSINVGHIYIDDIILTRPYSTIRYENTTQNFKTVFSGWDLSFISYTGNNNYSAELVYMVMHWFNMYDARTELRVTHLDIYYGNLVPLRQMTPMLGESYVLKARIWNPGGHRGDAVVRFSDGNTVIDSVSVTVEKGSAIIAEIIWTPLYAGSRTLYVRVDPDGLVSEIFKFNNIAQCTIKSYFFYDDMENGPTKWKHDSTVLRINGESPLEYMDPGEADTCITASWASLNGWYNTTDNASLKNVTSSYHSLDKAFYMHEPKKEGQKPVDVTLIIDISGSMNGAPLTAAKTAASSFIDKMANIDRVSVWSYGTNVYGNTALTYNKTYAKTLVAAAAEGGATAGWTAMYLGCEYTRLDKRDDAIPAVVFLTDGQFNNDLNPPYNKANTLTCVNNMSGPLFTIGLGGAPNVANLNDSAKASLGGRYYAAPSPTDLQNIYDQIAQVIAEMAGSLGRSAPAEGPAPRQSPEGGASGRSTSVTCYVDNTNLWTGFVNNTGFTLDGTIWARGNAGGTVPVRGFAKFNVTAIPDNQMIESMTLYMYHNSNSQVIDILELDNDPVTTAGATLWTDCGDGKKYINDWPHTQTGRWKPMPLGPNATDDLQSALAQNWFGVAVNIDFSNSNTNISFRGRAVAERPYIIVNYAPWPVVPVFDPPYWNNGDEASRDRNITTSTFSLDNASSAKLSFWHRYNLKLGSNGGVLMVGTSATGAANSFTYRYIMPTQPYSGNLRIANWSSAQLRDGYSNDIRWCWNGISGSGGFSWEYVEADLTQFAGARYVRVMFKYFYCQGGTGWGWAIDDIEVRVTRANSVAVNSNTLDQWELVKEGNTYGDDFANSDFALSGSYSWWNHNPQAGRDYLRSGIDNSLMSVPIDLSRAKDARLTAAFRFNIPFAEGRPPDGFRVEVSSDNGISWRQINMGIRSAWNVSGSEGPDIHNKSFTGVNMGNYWVQSGSLTRLNCDLSGWAGSVIEIRFRVVTRNDTSIHYQDNTVGFGGFFIDDVTVEGNTTTGREAPGCPADPAQAATGGPAISDKWPSIPGTHAQAEPAKTASDTLMTTAQSVMPDRKSYRRDTE